MIRHGSGLMRIECQCAVCDYTAIVERQWIERSGTPHCPAGHGPLWCDDPELTIRPTIDEDARL